MTKAKHALIIAFFAVLCLAMLVQAQDTSSGTWYMRGDTRTTYGVTGYKLDDSQSNQPKTIAKTYPGTLSVSFGVRVWIVYGSGSTVELTTGSPVAVVTRTSSGEGIQSANWTCPGAGDIVEAVLIKVYVKFGSGSWSELVSFVSDEQVMVKLPASTWTFSYYTNRAYSSEDGITYAIFMWGTSTYNSRVVYSYIQPNAWETMLYHITHGNFVGFITFPYVNLMGNLFYGVLLLIVGLTLYMRYEDVVPIAIIFVLFGGAGGIFTMLVPAAGLHLAWLFVAFGLAILFYRMVKGRGYGE